MLLQTGEASSHKIAVGLEETPAERSYLFSMAVQHPTAGYEHGHCAAKAVLRLSSD